MNPNTMTLAECRDWLAIDDGWEWRATELRTYPHWTDKNGDPWLDAKGYDAHPYPPTLDAAASAMPEGWDWRRVGGEYLGGNKVNGGGIVTRASVTDTDDEKLDRARLAVACRMAAKKENNRE